MSNATFAFGRFNPPTEEGHGKLVSAVQQHAEETSGKHYIFPTKSQDKKKNPMSHEDKVGAMKKLFPTANIASHKDVHTVIDAMKHLESKGHTHVTMVAGSDRVDEFRKLLNNYKDKEYPKIKKISVVSAGHRDPDAEGAEGMSASKLRGLVAAGKKKEFVSHYSDPKIGAHIHDKVKEGMQMKESVSPVGIFLLGGPGSGKDYVLKNIFSRFDLTEVQADQLVNGAAAELYEGRKNIVINGVADAEKISIIQSILEGYDFDYVHVSVTNKVSRIRNERRDQPLSESKRIEKFLKAEKLSENYDCFRFNNSINLNESTEMEQVLFGGQIEKLLERVVNLGLEIKTQSEPKLFMVIKEQGPMTGAQIQKKKFTDVRRSETDRRVRDTRVITHENAHIHAAAKGSMSEEVWDEPNPKKKSKPLSAAQQAKAKSRSAKAGRKYPNLVDNMWAANEEVEQVEEGLGDIIKNAKHEVNKAQVNWQSKHRATYGADATKTSMAISAVAKLAGINAGQARGIGSLLAGKPVTKQQKQAAANRVGKSAINKMRKEDVEQDIDALFEMQLVGTDSYRDHALSTTPGQSIEEPLADKNSCVCGGSGECQCEVTPIPTRTFKDLRKEAKDSAVDLQPELSKANVKKKRLVAAPRGLDSTMQGLPVSSRFSAFESKDPALEEAIQYHLDNNISITENIFRPGSQMFFEMINEAKRLYNEGKYIPVDEFEKQMLKSDIGEKAIYEGEEVILDFPFEIVSEDSDPTNGHGVGKPFRKNGGGAVYVKSGDKVHLLNFSQSGMKKRINEPGRVRSFVARHHCLTNTDKTSAEYWACRWPRYFSNTGQQWW